MKFNRRQFLENSSKLALGAGIITTAGTVQLLATNSARAEQVAGLYEGQPLPDKWLGKHDAPVTIVVYASMTCPHCKNFHKNVLPKIKKNYLDTGKARIIFREFPLDNLAAAAAMLARCAPGDNYFPMIDVLFDQQDKWARSSDPVSELLRISRLAGFSKESFDSCLRDQSVLDKVIASRTQGAKKFKVDATPTFFIGGVKFSGDLSYEGISKAIDALL